MRIRPTRIHLLFFYFVLISFALQLSCSKDNESFIDAVIEKPEIEILVEENDNDSAESNEELIEEVENNLEENLENRTTSFPTIHDAHLQSGRGYNQSIVRLQEDFRTSYLMFDLSPIDSIKGNIVAVSLQFTIALDDGNGNITVFKSASNEWSETDLSANSAPIIGVELGSITKEYPIGSTEVIELSAAEISPQISSLILVHEGGNDLAFASKEHIDKIGPKLVVSYNVPLGSEEITIVSEEETTEEETTEEETTEEETTEEETTEEETTEEETTEEETTEEETTEEETTEEENTGGTSTNEEPMAVADATPSSGGAPLTVTFKGDNSSDDKAIASYFWDFKDGATATNANPSHTFTEVGTYQVELTVTDDQDVSSSDVATITVTENENSAPIAKVSATPLTGEAPLQVAFKGSDSTDDISISSYTWDYKDGSSENKADTSHIFTTAGTYIVELTVKDENGLSDKETVTITVTEPINIAPVALLTANPVTGIIPLQVQFVGDISTDDNAITSYLWQFKDGQQNATIPNPTHTFNEPGTYIVELTVTDIDGLSNKKTISITANALQNQAPVAIATADITSGNAALEVQFRGDTSTDDNAITSYTWKFKDGKQDATIANPTHTFTDVGSYTVELIVEDAAGLSSTSTVNISVNSADTGTAPPGSLYVTTGGLSSNDGLSEATAWDIEYAFQNAKAGDHVFIKAGDYGNVELKTGNAGTQSNPVRFIGYRQTPGDINANNGSTFNYGDNLDSTKMPLIKGRRTNNIGEGFGIYNFYKYIEVSNIQMTHYEIGVFSSGDNTFLDNVIITEVGDFNPSHTYPTSTSNPSLNYKGIGIKVSGDYSTIKNCFVLNAGAEGYRFSECQYQTQSYNKVYSDSSVNPCDYYYLLATGATDNEVSNIYVERVGDLAHAGHGLVLKFNSKRNTIRNSKVKNTWLELSYSEVSENQFINCEVVGGPNNKGALLIANGAHHNTFTNTTVKNCNGVAFSDWDEDFSRGDVKNAGHHNTFEQCTFDNNLAGLNFFWFSQNNPESPAHDNIFNNCSFSNMDQLFMIDRVNYGNIIKNSSINNISNLKNSFYPTLHSDIPLEASYQNNTLTNCGFTLD